MTLAASIALWLPTIRAGVIVVDTLQVPQGHIMLVESRQITETSSRESVDVDMKTGVFSDS